MTTLFNFLIVKVLNAAWNKGKQLVQAIALYYLVVTFVAFFIASYVSQPRPLVEAQGAGH